MGTSRYLGGRRTYKIGRPCQDCGRTVPVTLAHFWVNGMPYRLCSTCIRPYRTVLLYPCSKECSHATR